MIENGKLMLLSKFVPLTKVLRFKLHGVYD
jgi:hypothetical protein